MTAISSRLLDSPQNKDWDDGGNKCRQGIKTDAVLMGPSCTICLPGVHLLPDVSCIQIVFS